MHGACAGVELERCVVPSEALVAALDSAHRALNDVYRWVMRSEEWGAGSEEWGAASAEWGAGSEGWGVGSKSGQRLACVQALCGLSWMVSQPASSSRIVLHEQHSERKIGLCGSLAWHCSSLARLWWEKPCTPMRDGEYEVSGEV